MDILLAEILTLIGLFVSMVLFVMLPFRIVRKSTASIPKYDKLICLANCLSGGVFLATFFVGLLPEVRREMNSILADAHLSSSLPVTEVIVLFGFFLAMFVEQYALTAKERRHNFKDTDEKVSKHRPLVYNEESDVYQEASVGEDETALMARKTEELEESFEDDAAAVMMPGPMSSKVSHSHSHDGHPPPNGHHSEFSTGPGSHGHSHGVEALLQSSSALRFGILLVSLGVHSLFEGMALGLQTRIHTLVNLFIGVWLHECLIAFALGFSLLKLDLSVCRSWQIAILFSSLIPVGQIIGIAIGNSKSWVNHIVSTLLQAVAAGTFIQVTFFDIIPEGLGMLEDQYRMLKVLLLFLGFISIAIVTLIVTLQEAA